MKIIKSKYYYLEILITVFTVLAYFFALGPMHLSWLLWVAPLPLILYSFYGKKWVVALVAFFSLILGTILMFIATWGNTLIPWYHIDLPHIILDCALATTVLLLNSIIIKKWHFWLAVFFFPAAMVSIYLFRVLWLNNFLLFEIGFTQYDFLSLIQIVSVTGIWGICFLLNLLPNAIAIMVLYRHEKKIYLPILVTTVLLLIGTVVFGYYKISQPVAATKIRVGIAAHAYKQPLAVTLPKQVEKDLANPYISLNAYLNNVVILAKQGAQYILQPEYSVFLPVNFAGKQKIMDTIKETAKKYRVTVLFAFGEFDNTTKEVKLNHLIIFSPQGNIIGDYHKQHLVPAPFHENGIKPGNRIFTFPYQASSLGVAICRDMLHIDPATKYGRNSTGMLFVPALDFSPAEAWLVARVAMMQAVANGFSLARAGAYGYLTLSDYIGRMITLKPTSQTDTVYLVGDVPLGAGNTFYARHGNWFAWLCVILTFLIIILFQFINSNKGNQL